MEIKDLIGAVVVHKIFGQGIVEDAHDNYIEVFFSYEFHKGERKTSLMHAVSVINNFVL